MAYVLLFLVIILCCLDIFVVSSLIKTRNVIDLLKLPTLKGF